MTVSENTTQWTYACSTLDIPENGGACVLLAGRQIAIFNFTLKNTWYATDNLCPHKQQMALSRGMIGDCSEGPKVACPFHKRTFSLENGLCISDPTLSIMVYPIKVEAGNIFISL